MLCKIISKLDIFSYIIYDSLTFLVIRLHSTDTVRLEQNVVHFHNRKMLIASENTPEIYWKKKKKNIVRSSKKIGSAGMFSEV